MSEKIQLELSKSPCVLVVDQGQVPDSEIEKIKILIDKLQKSFPYAITVQTTNTKTKPWKPRMNGDPDLNCPLRQLKSHLNKLTEEKYPMISKDIKDLF